MESSSDDDDDVFNFGHVSLAAEDDDGGGGDAPALDADVAAALVRVEIAALCGAEGADSLVDGLAGEPRLARLARWYGAIAAGEIHDAAASNSRAT